MLCWALQGTHLVEMSFVCSRVASVLAAGRERERQCALVSVVPHSHYSKPQTTFPVKACLVLDWSWIGGGTGPVPAAASSSGPNLNGCGMPAENVKLLVYMCRQLIAKQMISWPE